MQLHSCMHGIYMVYGIWLYAWYMLQLTGKHLFCLVLTIFLGAVPITGAFLNHLWPVMIYDINCTGSEQTLKDCPHNGITNHLCQPREAASLICQSEYSELVWVT